MASMRKKKRARRQVKGKVNDVDPCDATTETNLIDDLPESLLLLEIFSRLRNPRDIIVCKSVSKSWNYVLSSSFHYDQSLALLINTQPPCATNDICLDGWKGFNLNNYIDPEFNNSPVCVLASYKDVLLCMKYPSSSRRKHRSQYYIVNPVTMRWARLPETHTQLSVFPIGLSGNGSKDRYYVVRLAASTPSKLTLRVLDSKRGQWKFYDIEHPPWSQSGWWPTQCQALNFNKALHWLAHDGPIVAYDPNYRRHKCIIIHRSQEMRHASHGHGAVVSETLTVSLGHLRIIQLICYPFPNHGGHHLSIWTLVDYEQSLWKQEHESVYFKDMVSGIPWIQDYMREYNLETTKEHDMSFLMTVFMGTKAPPETRERIIFPHPLLCHPNNPLLVYLYLPESIVSLDVVTKRLRLITTDIKRGLRAKFCRHELGYDMVIPMTLHLDPSSVLDHDERVLRPPRRKHTVC